VPPVPPPTQAEKQAQSKRVDDLAKKEKDVEGKDDTHGVFGPFRIGPIFGVGLPAFFSIGGAIKLTKYFGAGINYGIVPTIQFAYYGEATVRYQGVGIYGHIHPFGGGFFLGASIGYAHVRGTYEDQFPVPMAGNFPYESEATMQTLVLTPELGYFYTFKSGFTLGVESGLQIPVAPSEIHFKSSVNYPDEFGPETRALVQDQLIEPTDEMVQDTLEKVGQTILPTIGIKIGWLF
jgi:hypothetical protein